MDRAKMEEVAQMLWMILTVAVFLDTREKIAVLVSQFSMLWNSHLTSLGLLYSYADYPLSSVYNAF